MSFRDVVFSALTRDGPKTAAELVDLGGKSAELTRANLSNMVCEKLITRIVGYDDTVEYRITPKGREHFAKHGKPVPARDAQPAADAETGKDVPVEPNGDADQPEQESIDIGPSAWQATQFDLPMLGDQQWFVAHPHTARCGRLTARPQPTTPRKASRARLRSRSTSIACGSPDAPCSMSFFASCDMPKSSRPRRGMPAPAHRPPSAVQVQQTFAPIFGFLATLRTGEVWCTDSGAPIMPVWGGELYEACPALEGWISCWRRIVAGERLDLDLEPLALVHDKLRSGEPLTIEMIEAARRCTYGCRRAYSRLPRARARSYSLTELIAVEVEACGLVE